MTWALPFMAALFSASILVAMTVILFCVLALNDGDEPPDASSYSIVLLALTLAVGLPGTAVFLVLA